MYGNMCKPECRLQHIAAEIIKPYQSLVTVNHKRMYIIMFAGGLQYD